MVNIIGPVIFAIIGGIFSIIGSTKHKSKLATFLKVINGILLFRPEIHWVVGSFIFGI